MIRDIAHHTSDVFEHHLVTRDLWRAGISWERAPAGTDESDPCLTVHRFRSDGEYLTAEMAEFLQAFGYDVLAIHSTHPSLLEATEYTKAKVLFMPQTKTQMPLKKYLDRVDQAIVLLGSDRWHFMEHGLDGSRIAVLPRLVDTEIFRPVERPQSENRHHLLYVGRIAPGKCVWMLPMVLRKLRDQDVRYTLDIVGDYDHPERDKPPLMQALIANRVRGSVHFGVAWTVEEMAEAYRAADVLVSASVSETFGQTFVEALACGLPVVTTAGGGCREWAEGYVQFVDSAEDMAQAIVDASYPLADFEAVARFHSEYSWQARKAEFVEIVEEMMR